LFDWILRILELVWEALIPWVVIQPFESAALTRLGKYKRNLEPGFHWCLPFHIDRVWHENITPRTSDLMGLAVTTSDGKAIGFDAVVTWKINDIRKAMLECTDLHDAIQDTCAGQIGTTLTGRTWEDIKDGKPLEELSKACRARGWKWGVEIVSVQLKGVTPVKTFRLTGSAQKHELHLPPAGG
jgi:regulator of protease activity HflC (stomatin/prohibitin superfamily)